MSELLNKTLAQIVTGNHQAATVFEKYHLDFCCKGKRPLSEAINEKHLPVEAVVKELNEVLDKTASKNTALINYISLSQLCDYIVATHHAYVRQSSTQIGLYLEKIAGKHGVRHPELVEILQLFTTIAEEMTDHMYKEENVLFPRIKELEKHYGEKIPLALPASAYIEAPIAMMEQEHESAGSLLEKIREKTNNYTAPADACTTYRVAFAALQAFEADLHQHVHMENNILFPKAIEMIKQLNTQAAN
jgi:regulator of cell morphogenesis and NO signaling